LRFDWSPFQDLRTTTLFACFGKMLRKGVQTKVHQGASHIPTGEESFLHRVAAKAAKNGYVVLSDEQVLPQA